jgi:hypothetical protein
LLSHNPNTMMAIAIRFPQIVIFYAKYLVQIVKTVDFSDYLIS